MTSAEPVDRVGGEHVGPTSVLQSVLSWTRLHAACYEPRSLRASCDTLTGHRRTAHRPPFRPQPLARIAITGFGSINALGTGVEAFAAGVARGALRDRRADAVSEPRAFAPRWPPRCRGSAPPAVGAARAGARRVAHRPAGAASRRARRGGWPRLGVTARRRRDARHHDRRHGRRRGGATAPSSSAPATAPRAARSGSRRRCQRTDRSRRARASAAPGRASTVSTACSSGANALGIARRLDPRRPRAAPCCAAAPTRSAA